MKLPDKLRVGSFDFDIIVWSNEKAEDVGKFGEFDAAKGTVSIDTSREHKTLDTVMHEALHAIWWSSKLSGKVGEEDAVSVLSSGVLLMLRDNPEILKLINQWVKRTK